MQALSVEEYRNKENNLQKRIQNGDVEAYRLLGDLYYSGLSGNERNEERAYTFWLQAADRGDEIAAGNIGMRMFAGVYGKERQPEAVPYLKSACKYADGFGNITTPLVMLGDAYRLGIGCQKDISRAEACYAIAALKNDPAAQYQLGILLYQKDKTNEESIRWLCCAHINGNRNATESISHIINEYPNTWTRKKIDATIADIFENGIRQVSGIGFTKQQFEQYVQDIKSRADKGSIYEMRLLGDLLRSGYDNDGNGKDNSLANRYYEMAAARGDAESVRKLGQYYLGIDDNKAFRLISQAAAGRDPKARYALGIMYRYGMGCDADPQKAIQILTPLALLNHGNSQYQLYNSIMDTRVEEKTTDDLSHNLNTTYRALHWLACAYVNGVDDAINTAKEMNLESVEMFQQKIAMIRQYGIDDSKYPIEKKESDEANNSSRKDTPKEGCYIATCVYGSYDSPKVWALRRYRDEVLRKSLLGKLFIRLYYSFSPVIVSWFGEKQWFHDFWRYHLDNFIVKLKDDEISNLAQDKK